MVLSGSRFNQGGAMKIQDLHERVSGYCRRTASSLLNCQFVTMRNPAPIISFTFDDFPRSALHNGGAILKFYGFSGTYYAALGRMDQDSPVGKLFSAADLEKAVASGHELGCHTFWHRSAWETSPSMFEESILKNRSALAELLPGQVFRTLSYPISEPHPGAKKRAEKYFSCCRGGGQTFNVGRTDRNNVRAFFLEQSRDEPARIKEMIQENCQQGGWLVFATHDVSPAPTRFGCTPELFEEIVRCAANSRAKILPVAKAWECVAGDEKRHSAVANASELNAGESTNKRRFDCPA